MGAARHDQGTVLRRAVTHSVEHGQRTTAHELQRTIDLQLLDVLRQVAAGHALVDVLVACQSVEFLDACLHVVARHALTVSDGLEVHLVHHGLIGRDGFLRDIHAEVALSAHDGDPQLALEHDLVLGAPQPRHLRRGVAVGQDVGVIGLRVIHAAHYRMSPSGRCLP